MGKEMKILRVPYEEFLKNPNTVDMKELQYKEPFDVVKLFLKRVYNIEVTGYIEYYFETKKIFNIPVPTALVIKYY